MDKKKLNRIRRNGIILIISGSFLGIVILFFAFIFIVADVPPAAVIILFLLFCVTALPLFIIGIRYRKHPELYSDHLIGTVRKPQKNYKNMVIDKSKYHYDSACEKYCEQYDKRKEELNDEDLEIIWEYAGNHIAIFLTWLIEYDFFIGEEGEGLEDEIREVKDRKITGDAFLSGLDEVLVKDDISDNVYDFIDDYYDVKYLEQYRSFMKKNRKKNMYETVFSWEDYDALKPIIDEAYHNFQSQ